MGLQRVPVRTIHIDQDRVPAGNAGYGLETRTPWIRTHQARTASTCKHLLIQSKYVLHPVKTNVLLVDEGHGDLYSVGGRDELSVANELFRIERHFTRNICDECNKIQGVAWNRLAPIRTPRTISSSYTVELRSSGKNLYIDPICLNFKLIAYNLQGSFTARRL